MPDVFVSYASADDAVLGNLDRRGSSYITHEEVAPVTRFLNLFRHHVSVQALDVYEDDSFFVDQEQQFGEVIRPGLASAIAECGVMLAFFSPNYFSSRPCLEEWRAFIKAEAEDESDRLLVPILVRQLEDGWESALADEPDYADWVANLTTVEGRRYVGAGGSLLDPDSEPLASQIAKLEPSIREQILVRRRVAPGRSQASNVLVVRSLIHDYEISAEIEAELAAGRDVLRHEGLDPVAVVYAGGTVGMVHAEGADQRHADFRMAAGAADVARFLRNRLGHLPFNVNFFALDNPIDSSNVTPADWVGLAALLRRLFDDHQGIVVLHGTNTLAYTASAVSFLLEEEIERPIVFTGSEVPLSVHNTDAVHNVENAIRAAAPDFLGGPLPVPEVCVYWGNSLFRANRTTKMFASDRARGFHTPNVARPIATLSNEQLEVDPSAVIRRKERSASQRAALRATPLPDLENVRVEILFIYPNMRFDDLEARFGAGLDGLILLSYGSGNVPEDPRFLQTVKALVEAGTVVVNVTQCPYGRVELKLFETSAALFDLGVVDAYDMTLEAAYTKLISTLARKSNRKATGAQASIRRDFQRSQAGEMSASIHRLDFGPSDQFKSRQDGLATSDTITIEAIDAYDINEAYLRLDNVSLSSDVPYCDVAIYYGVPEDVRFGGVQAAGVNSLAVFRRQLSEEERSVGSFDKNLQVTHEFRKALRGRDIELSIAVADEPSLTFGGVSLVLYTRGER